MLCGSDCGMSQARVRMIQVMKIEFNRVRYEYVIIEMIDIAQNLEENRLRRRVLIIMWR